MSFSSDDSIFNPAALDNFLAGEIAVEDESPVVFDDAAVNTLSNIAADSQPAGQESLQEPPSETKDELPDYLDSIKYKGDDTTSAAPVEVDYKKLANETFKQRGYSDDAINSLSESVNDRDTFEETIFKQDWENRYLSDSINQIVAKSVPDFLAVIEGTKDDMMIVQDKVKNDIREEGRRLHLKEDKVLENIDNALSTYINEGELTEEGKRLAAQQKSEYVNYFTKLKGDAKKYAQTQYEDYSKLKSTISKVSEESKIFGFVDLDANYRAELKEFVLSGKLDEELNKELSNQEKSERLILFASLLNPKIKQKVFSNMYQKFKADGVNETIKKYVK